MKLKSGGLLYEEEYNPKTKEYDLIDVTDEAPSYLHENVTIEGVTLRDIYTLVSKHPAIQETLKRNFIKEFLAYIAKNPQSTAKVDPENPEASIEFIEIYRTAYYDEELNVLEFDSIPSVHGMSHVLKKEQEGFQPGTRINWSLSFTPVTDLLDLPIQFKSLVITQEENHLNHYNFTKPLTFNRHRYTLAEIINAITWELSFYGTPEDSAETGEQLNNVMDDVKDAIEAIEEGEIEASEVFISADSIFPRDEFLPGISFISEEINKKEFNTLMHYLPNKVDVALFLGTAFPGKIFLKEEYIGLTAYEYRHKMQKADSELLLSEEMKGIINDKKGLRPPHFTFIEDNFYSIVENLGGKITEEQIHNIMV